MSLYNEFVQDHYRHPRNLGRLEGATASARVMRGDTMMEFHLRVEDETIHTATFRAIGCAGTVAAGSAMTEWLRGKTLTEASAVTAQTVLDTLQGLPDDRLYCADFAAETIQTVIDQERSGSANRAGKTSEQGQQRPPKAFR